ncbi:filamentous temperature sensitive Z [Ectocarpus siliculosus]|uniref:Filamentous temperature sensitive Z n=1 Tax=Ectocarpus siliculosus TaxID=2880 RepID=D8LJ21_ECTSI|nr:filamentous temperature sensitive Z [Ectocarpus siliculosus]|eukprot:CBN76905.1 filamentous temperature sensitive Z [Ectocarpus siliculosus]
MTQQTIPGVEFWCLNTDAQAINSIPEAIKTLQVGNDVTRGLGAGGVPDIGKRAAEESRADIAEGGPGTKMVFVPAGMGGGTGSGAPPLVAHVAKEMGALTGGVVTKPFGFEGRRRLSQASAAINELRGAVDTLIVVANDRLLEVAGSGIPLERAFSVADDILRQGVVGISEIIVRPGIINVDFADVRSVMSNAGTALMGIGSGEGKTKAEDAANAAISSPLLDSPIDKAKGIVFNIIGGNDMSLQEINAAAEVIYGEVDPTANIIFGALVDERMEGRMSITVLATGFQTKAPRRLPPPGYQPPPPKQGGRTPPPTTPPLPGGANNPSDIPDFLTRLKRSSQR